MLTARIVTIGFLVLVGCGSPPPVHAPTHADETEEGAPLTLPPGFTPSTQKAATVADPAKLGKPAKADQTTPLPTSSGPGREPSEAEWDALNLLARKAEQLRGLKFKNTPKIRIQTAAQIGAFVATEYESEAEIDIKRLDALGLLDPDLDMRKVAESQAQRGILGYYDPATKQLIVRDDIAVALTHHQSPSVAMESRSTIVHELVHALQDQHFDLERGRASKTTLDARNAYAALVEGDATLATMHWSILRAGFNLESVMKSRETFEPMIKGTSNRPFGLSARVPSSTALRYSSGATFAAALYHTGGWARVNRAYETPPKAAAEVLDPSRYFQGVRSDDIKSCAAGPLEKARFRVLEDQVLGQLLVAVYLSAGGLNGMGMSDRWLGDRFWLVEKGSKLGFAWIISFHTKDDAIHAEEFMPRAIAARKLIGHEVRARQKGRAMLITSNLGEPLHEQLGAMLDRCVSVADRPR